MTFKPSGSSMWCLCICIYQTVLLVCSTLAFCGVTSVVIYTTDQKFGHSLKILYMLFHSHYYRRCSLSLKASKVPMNTHGIVSATYLTFKIYKLATFHKSMFKVTYCISSSYLWFLQYLSALEKDVKIKKIFEKVCLKFWLVVSTSVIPNLGAVKFNRI